MNTSLSQSNNPKDASGSIANVFGTFLKLGLTSFGGPVAHLGYFHKELVEKQRWVSESQYAQLLAICQFLPGPASSQLGFALGLLRSGWFGALAAFIGFTLPSALLLVAFASALPYLSGSVGEAAIHGLKLVACAVVADAVLGMFKKLCPDTQRRSIAVVAAGVLLLVGSAWVQILVVLGGAAAGIWLCREVTAEAQVSLKVSYGKRTGLALLVLFVLFFIALTLFADHSRLLGLANAFYRAGALVFGGGHVVLPLLEDSVVASGWVGSESFLAGYGASQAIPGPMFSFSAYLGAIVPNEFGSVAGASVALLFMFVPGFLLVSAALPLWQSISHNRMAGRVIAGVNAAVVGLLGAALYDPVFTSGVKDGADLAVVLIGFAMLAVWKQSALRVVAWCVVVSVLLSFAKM
ncbi:chromate efflux transporter [Parendozoicomonas sp. Alg238-R29]|uniref:chromate efflux transporter n=1 Tax=Parendozoicomonas sp. Alg238-R29 TaxID=2993446 RepID=UPI00248DD3B2|nr:chromate efflux transporter [Parendozoicomonas sp. Alg238-R29]